MSHEQYLYDRLEWYKRHDGRADIVVSICVIVAAFLAFSFLL